MKSTSQWQEWQCDYLREHYPHGNTNAIAAHLGFNPQRIRTKANELGVTKAPGAKAKRIGKFTPQMDDALREHYATKTNAELAEMLGMERVEVAHRAMVLGLRKTTETKGRTVREALLRAGPRQGQFKSGNVPWNKGIKGYSVELGRSHFKPGSIPPTHVPVGTERWTTPPKSKPDAPRYLRRKVAEPNVWMKVHHIVWEAHHGPIPDGHVVVFRDGNTANIEIENLHCLPRGELGMANGACVPYHLTDAYRLMRELQKTIEDSEK